MPKLYFHREMSILKPAFHLCVCLVMIC